MFRCLRCVQVPKVTILLHPRSNTSSTGVLTIASSEKQNERCSTGSLNSALLSSSYETMKNSRNELRYPFSFSTQTEFQRKNSFTKIQQ